MKSEAELAAIIKCFKSMDSRKFISVSKSLTLLIYCISFIRFGFSSALILILKKLICPLQSPVQK